MSAAGASQLELTGAEAHLVDAARNGDVQAFAALYARYERRIFAYVLGMVRDHSRAEDIVQDVFVSALRRMRSSDREISFKPWIYEIAKNACIDYFRRAHRSREVPIEQDGIDCLVSPAPSPDRCLEQRQQLDALRGAFRGLSERQHTVMVLREFEGLTYAEIARRTGMTLPMVESTLLRARRKLIEEYAEIASGRRCRQVHRVIETGGQPAVDALGLRERRRLARHIAHCQPCARFAQMAGIIVPDARRTLVEKLAGLLPLPFARRPVQTSGHGGGGSHPAAVLRSARSAARIIHPGALAGASPAAVATVAAIVIIGGGTAVKLLAPGHTHRGTGSAGTTTATPASVVQAAPAARPRSDVKTHAAASPGAPSSKRVRMHGPGGTGTANAGGGSGNAKSVVSPSTLARSSGRVPASSQPTPSGLSPSLPSVHSPLPLPQVPQLPHVPQVSHVRHVPQVPRTVTNPVKKVVKKIVPPLPGSPPVGGVGGL